VACNDALRYTKIDQTPNGHIADLNSSSGGTEVFICYKKKVSSDFPTSQLLHPVLVAA
jgi:hypothetical protein